MTPEEIEFLKQSNYIEDVRDSDSLDQAVIAWKYLKTKKQLTPDTICKTHRLLMKNQKIRSQYKGRFRNVAVGVYKNGKKIKDTLEWENIPLAIKEWCKQTTVTISDEMVKQLSKDLLEREIKLSHVFYEAIHPFIDGNGRTGRMFLNWQRLQCELPILVIKEEERQQYYAWFK